MLFPITLYNPVQKGPTYISNWDATRETIATHNFKLYLLSGLASLFITVIYSVSLIVTAVK